MSKVKTQWKKGQSGNPGGRAKESPEIRAFKETTYKDFITNLQKFGSFSRDEIAEELDRPDATMFELMFGNIVSGAASGDKDARNVLLDRLWGKVTEKHEIKNYDAELSQVSKERIVEFLKEKE